MGDLDNREVGKSLEKLKKSLEKRMKILHDSEIKLEELDASIQVAKKNEDEQKKHRVPRYGSPR